MSEGSDLEFSLQEFAQYIVIPLRILILYSCIKNEYPHPSSAPSSDPDFADLGVPPPLPCRYTPSLSLSAFLPFSLCVFVSLFNLLSLSALFISIRYMQFILLFLQLYILFVFLVV